MGGKWIRQNEGRGAVVFVHGINSNAKKCFTHSNGTYWPRLLSGEIDFDDVGIYTFEYHTGIRSGGYTISDASDALREGLINDKVLNNPWNTFVAHSMGGLVTRQFIVSEQIRLLKQETKIGLMLVASPTLGSWWANLVSLLTRIVPNAQRDDLRVVNDRSWLNDLNTKFRRMVDRRDVSIVGVELIEDRFFHCKLWQVIPRIVPTSQAAVFFCDPLRIAESDHKTIAKPDSRVADQHARLLRLLRDTRIACKSSGQSATTPALHGTADTMHDEIDSQLESGSTGPYIDRPEIEKAIADLVFSSEISGKLCILFGFAGAGKTTLLRRVSDMPHTMSRRWIDCNLAFDRPKPLSVSDDLLVVDNLTADHPFLTQDWVRMGSVPMIISTTDDAVVVECLSRAGLSSHGEVVVSCPSFSEVETAQFLNATCGDVSRGACDLVHRMTDGSPIALQICRALLLELHFVRDLRELVPSASCEALIKVGLEHWLAKRGNEGQLLGDILECLSTIPFAGLSPATLTRILRADSGTVVGALAYMQKLGFVQATRLGKRGDEIFSTPSRIRDAFALDDGRASRRIEWRQTYFRHLLSGNLSDRPALELFDAWLMGWQVVFEQGVEEFAEKFEAHSALILATESKNEAFGGFIEGRLATILARRGRALMTESCPIVIALAQFLGHKKPKTPTTALYVWRGAFNADAWARGASINCAAIHWIASGKASQLVAHQHLVDWMHVAIEHAQAEEKQALPQKERHWSMVPDVDFCAAIGALIRLGKANSALDFLESRAYTEVFPDLTLAHVVCVFALAGQKQFVDDRFSPRVLTFTRRRKVPESLAQRALLIANETIHWLPTSADSGNRNMQPFKLSKEDAMISATLAQLVGAKTIVDWVRAQFPNVTVLF